MSALHPGYACDVASVLGIGTTSSDPLPQPEPGEVVLRIPDGLTLQALRDSPAGQTRMWRQDWYDKSPCSKAAPPAGRHRLRIPVPGSQRKTCAEQQALLPQGEQVAPVVLVAVALLCIQRAGGADPLQDRWTRCAELAAGGCRVDLDWSVGRLFVNVFWDG